MNREEQIKFISDPGGLNMASEAEWLSGATTGICGWVALGGAAVVAGFGLNLQGAEAASKGVPRDPKTALVLLLAGAGVGGLVGGAACVKIKLALNEVFQRFATARDAVLKLDARSKMELVAEAQKLIRLRKNIDEQLKPEPESRFTRSA